MGGSIPGLPSKKSAARKKVKRGALRRLQRQFPVVHGVKKVSKSKSGSGSERRSSFSLLIDSKIDGAHSAMCPMVQSSLMLEYLIIHFSTSSGASE